MILRIMSIVLNTAAINKVMYQQNMYIKLFGIDILYIYAYEIF